MVDMSERLENQRWAANRGPYDDAAQAEAFEILSCGGDNPPDPGDEIPAEYLPWKKRREEEAEAASRPLKPLSRA
jgi:hypothetical protein